MNFNERIWGSTKKIFSANIALRAIHNCQHLIECTKDTFTDPAPPKVYTSTFFKWIICHENDKKIGKNVESVWKQCLFQLTPSP